MEAGLARSRYPNRKGTPKVAGDWGEQGSRTGSGGPLWREPPTRKTCYQVK